MRTSPTLTAIIALSLSLALGLAGCGRSDTAGLTDAANPDVLVKNAVETRTSLSSIAGKGVMRIVDQPNRFGLTVNADVVADEADRLRIRADKLAGAIQAFDVVMLGDDIGFYVPTQNTLYHGKVADLQNFAFRFDPDEVLRQMLRPETSLLLKKWRHAPALPGDSAAALIVEEDTPAASPRLRLAINRASGRLSSVTQLDAAGQPLFVKRYDDYRDLAQGGARAEADAGAGAAFPYLISFVWPRDKRMMEMHFKQVEGNAVVLDEDFDIAASADTQYLPLVNAQMDSGDEPLAMAPVPAGPAGPAGAGL